MAASSAPPRKQLSYLALNSDPEPETEPEAPPMAAWHERFGPVTKSVTVRAGAVATVDFAYTGNEKPAAAVEEFRIHAN